MSIRYAVAIDLGATRARAALVGDDGTIHFKRVEPTIAEGKNGRVITEQIARLIQSVLDDSAGLKNDRVGSIGVAAAGPFDRVGKSLRNSPNLAFGLVPLTVPLEKRFNAPIALIKDAHADALAEQCFGAAKKISTFVYVTISTGIGGGVITDGMLFKGRSENAAEVGHITVDTVYNLSCSCRAGKGHWEAYASGRNIPHFFKQWSGIQKAAISFPHGRTEEIMNAAQGGNALARRFLKELAIINGRALSTIVAAYDPELIVFGGGVMLHNRFLLTDARTCTDRFLALPPMKVTTLGDDIGLLGAAVAAFRC